MSARREAALVEIERQTQVNAIRLGASLLQADEFWRWATAVLEGHKATLKRHYRTRQPYDLIVCGGCGYPLGGITTPDDCPDAAHVLDLYAPEVGR